MKVAREYSKLSYAVRKKVGCVIVRDDRILSIGYNGTPAGWDNACEDRVLWDKGKQLPEPTLVKIGNDSLSLFHLESVSYLIS